jgi:hypothetical protein
VLFRSAQMFDHELNPLKGWPSPYALDFEAEYADGVSGAQAGMVVSLDSNGKFERGLTQTGAMPIFLFQNQSDFDVRSDRGNIAGGVASGLVAVGAYELQSTEFVAGSYSPNDPLTVVNAAGDNQGKLTSGTLYTDDIVGIVSRGQSESEHDATIGFLAFWPVYLPATP